MAYIFLGIVTFTSLKSTTLPNERNGQNVCLIR